MPGIKKEQGEGPGQRVKGEPPKISDDLNRRKGNEKEIMPSKYLYINTIGCQMNVYDSDQIVNGLKPLRYKPALSMDTADLIILNTCAIREKAQQKAYSFLGRLARLKRKKPDLIIGVGGCVAQQEGKKFLARMPHIDFVFGTHAVGRLPAIIEKVAAERCRVVDIEMSDAIDELQTEIESTGNTTTTRFVTIMRGCDNFCAYCVVPYVRGREVSRNPENILQEIETLVASGVREITLLGQNVNSYGKKESMCTFPELLARVNDIKGLKRIRFTTSHPKDLSKALMRAFVDLEKLCNHIHLPVQSGSDRILKKMNRKYTRDAYLDKVAMLRRHRADMAITSDFIVGFPGETVSDFEQTLDLIQEVEYDGLFAFMYSDRPSASAGQLPGKISETEKKERLQRLLELQAGISMIKNQALVGSTVQILVDGLSKKQGDVHPPGDPSGRQWSGRTTTNRIVNFYPKTPAVDNEILRGKRVQVRIEKALAHSLWGRPLDLDPRASDLKGEESYAA